MAKAITETTKTASLTAEENTNGKAAKCTPENLCKAKSREKANGSNHKLHQTAIHMKVSISMTWNMDMVSSHGRAGMFIRETLLKMKGTFRARCSGRTEASTKASGKEEYSMGLEESYFLMGLWKRDYLRTMFTKLVKLYPHTCWIQAALAMASKLTQCSFTKIHTNWINRTLSHLVCCQNQGTTAGTTNWRLVENQTMTLAESKTCWPVPKMKLGGPSTRRAFPFQESHSNKVKWAERTANWWYTSTRKT